MWGNPTLFHPAKSIGKKVKISRMLNIDTINWEKLLIDPLTTNNAIHHDSLTLSKKIY